MSEYVAKNIVTRLRKKWIFKAMLSQFFIAFGAGLILSSLLYKFYDLSLYLFVPGLFVFFILLRLFDRRTKITDEDVSRYLNVSSPSLEESTGLLLKPQSSLNSLEKFQLKKIEGEIQKIETPDPFRKRLSLSVLLLLIASTISIAMIKIPFGGRSLNIATDKALRTKVDIPETVLPEIKSSNIIIVPPSYTGKPSKRQSTFNLIAEEGAKVVWQIETSIPAKEVKLIFNDGSSELLSKSSGEISRHSQRQINKPGFYQVRIDDQLSELYKIEIIKDQHPTIAIQAPRPNTYLNYGVAQTVLLRGNMADDYGIKSAHISATISSGQGEGVKFKEQKLVVAGFREGQRQSHLQQSIDCKALNMRPGDELYFYISATDSRNHETRSQVYIITLQDTANLTSMNGLVSPLDIQPELFRSQRQIIIETEQLLKAKSKISAEEFTKKSNALGIDQKLLRMRYGKFLGEETDVDIGSEHPEGEEGHDDEPQDIIDQYSHKHDNAEDAGFFDSATKKQLKATLAEMWKAEMKLRTILPKDALPFEYKALALLKDLQQKSRVYVAKTGTKTTPLKPEKRLTGDLSKISQPVTQENIQKPETATIALRKALSILETLKADGRMDVISKEILQKAFYQLSVKAAELPAVYIPSLSALKKIIGENYRLKDIENAQQGIQKMVAAPDKFPFSGNTSAMGLSKQYFNNLKRNRQ